MTIRIAIIVGVAIAAVIFMFVIGKAADDAGSEDGSDERRVFK